MSKKYTRDEVIERIELVHPNKHEFDNFIFTRMSDKSILTCKIHGDYEITPHKSTSGRGCRECAIEGKASKLRRTLSSFTTKARAVHGEQYIYEGFTEIVNDTIPYKMFCQTCNKIVFQRVNEHLSGRHHRGCVSIPPVTRKVKVKQPASRILSDLQKNNSTHIKEWEYSIDWCENDLTDGHYVGFIYLFEFSDGSRYIGSKQMFKQVKDVKKLKGDSKENGWRDYSSSSKIVNQKISDGEDYRRIILWGFPTMAETLFVESYLIMLHGLDGNLLNKAVLNKIIFPYEKEKIRGIIRTIEEWLSM